MGKTYKNGYLSIKSYEGLPYHVFRCHKRDLRVRRRNYHKSLVNEYYNNSLRLDLRLDSHNNLPMKMGYCMNTCVSLNEIVNKFEECLNKFPPYENIKLNTLTEKEKIDTLNILNNNMLFNYRDSSEYRKHLNAMKKQMSRRGRIGYFKSHKYNL
jgi:hypothetical protein